MAKKKRARKIKKMKPKRKSLPLMGIFIKFLPYMFFVVAVFLVFKGAQNFFMHSAYFDVKNIEVAGHGPVQARLSIMKELSSRKDANIFLLDIKECEHAIERLYPEFKNIVVHRILPGTLFVSYELRKPVCQVISGHYYLVSDDGVIISQPQAAKQPGLVVVSGINISPVSPHSVSADSRMRMERAIGIVKDIDESYNLSGDERIAEINIYDKHNPVLILADKTRVELGRFRLKDKSEALKSVLGELASRTRKAKVIDLRFEDIVVVPR